MRSGRSATLVGAQWTYLAPSLAVALALLAVVPCRAEAPQCTREAVQAAAPPGVIIGPIGDLNPALPRVPTGALLVAATASAPAYCLITGSVVTNQKARKTANFGLALPLRWNRKFLFSGCAGYCGVVFQSLPTDRRGGGFPGNALAQGYAIAATDDGHASKPLGLVYDASWALGANGEANEEALTDFFFRAVHVVTESAKQLVQRWYGDALARAYFFGCSDGGREAMVEAARYPEDYDGYVAGAPFIDVPGQILAGRAARLLLDGPDHYIPPELLSVVDAAVHASCDELDGLEDGLIQNPGRCSFRPESLQCTDARTHGCLTPSQVKTLTLWFSAARDSQGRIVSHGFSVSDIYKLRVPGNGLYGWTEAAGPPREPRSKQPWGTDLGRQPPGWIFYDQSLKHLVFRDRQHDTAKHSPVNEDGVVEEAALQLLEARTAEGRGDDPAAFEPFVTSRRKLLMFHGYSDGFISPFRTARFYRDWAERVGGHHKLQESARLFMVPGMYHCNKGPGPNTFDAVAALDRWVEEGVAPDGLLASKHADDDLSAPVLRSMPLCAFPAQARYSGQGPIQNAGSWSCPPNQALLEVGENGAAAGFDGPRR